MTLEMLEAASRLMEEDFGVVELTETEPKPYRCVCRFFNGDHDDECIDHNKHKI
jgi:hypothetical protein